MRLSYCAEHFQVALELAAYKELARRFELTIPHHKSFNTEMMDVTSSISNRERKFLSCAYAYAKMLVVNMVVDTRVDYQAIVWNGEDSIFKKFLPRKNGHPVGAPYGNYVSVDAFQESWEIGNLNHQSAIKRETVRAIKLKTACHQHMVQQFNVCQRCSRLDFKSHEAGVFNKVKGVKLNVWCRDCLLDFDGFEQKLPCPNYV